MSLDQSTKRANRRRRKRPGDIYAISLPDHTYRFVRVLNSAAIGIYRQKSTTIQDVPLEDDYEFYLYVYDHAFKEWTFITHKRFETEEESWPPPFCLVDALTFRGSIFYHGKISPCKFEECKDLETLAIWDTHHLVDRLMGDESWTKSLRRPTRGTID